jgi:transposase
LIFSDRHQPRRERIGEEIEKVPREKPGPKIVPQVGQQLSGRAALGDKGYDSKSNREAARQRGICPAIPYRSNTKDIPVFFPKALYQTRARIEQAVGKLKRFKRIALRCEKTAQNYGSFVALATSASLGR